MARVSVIGSGVIGLTVAHELAGQGHQVTIISAGGEVSPVAAAIWFPYGVTPTPAVLELAHTTYRRLVDLAVDPETGVRLREGTVLSRKPDPDLSWAGLIAESHPARDAPPGATGVRCRLPLVVTEVYLAWLRDQVARRGVAFESRRLTSVDEVTDCDTVVVAAGLASASLLGGDPELYPVRGQVVRVANPGLTDWVLDDDNPGGLTYVVPRDHDVVLGGTDQVGSADMAPDPATEAAIIARATALVPALAGQPILSRAVGLRPARSSLRLSRIDGRVIACYGHGGSGFTLSWGTAAAVARLV
ncbi:MAG: FAD-dependent oxidoreductase [Actinoplanes sp.]